MKKLVKILINWLNSIRARLLLILLLPFLIFTGLSIYTSIVEYQREVGEVEQDLIRITDLIAIQENYLLSGTEQILQILAVQSNSRNQTDKACPVNFSNILSQFNRYANFGIADLKGNVNCSALPLDGPVNIADRAYFKDALLTNGFAYGEYQVGRISDRPSINFGYPILDSEGKPMGVVFAALAIEELSRLEAPVKKQLPANSIFYKIDKDGHIITSYPDTNQAGKKLPINDLTSLVLKGKTGTAKFNDPQNGKRIYAFTSINGQYSADNLYIILGVPFSEAIGGELNVITQSFEIFFVVISVLIIITAINMERYVVKDMRSLLTSFQRIAGGERGVRTGPPYASGELGQINRGFDEMATELENRQTLINQQISDLNQNNQMLTSLNQLGLILTNEANLSRIGKKIIDIIFTNCSGCSGFIGYSKVEPIHRINGDFDFTDWNLEFSDVTTIDPDTAKRIINKAYDQPDPLVINDFSSDDLGVIFEDIHPMPLTAAIYPIKGVDRILGTLILFSSQQGFSFQNFDVFIRSSIRLFGMTIERIFYNIRNIENVYREATLSKIGKRLTNTLDIDQILHELEKEVNYLTGPDGVFAVALYDKEKNIIERKIFYEEGNLMPPYSLQFGKGLISEIIEKNVIIWTDDYLEECKKRNIKPVGKPSKSWIGVPIEIDNTVLGAIIAEDYKRSGIFSERDVQILSTLASQTAIAIKNARLYEEVQRNFYSQTKLFEASTNLLQQEDLDKVLSGIVTNVKSILEADEVNVMLIENGYCYQWTGVGFVRPLEPHPIRTNGLTNQVIISGEPLFISNLLENPSVIPRMIADGVRSSACLPLISKSTNLGVMWVNFNSFREFSRVDKTTMQSFANHIAVAVEMKKLLNETKQRLVELDTIQQISIAMRNAGSIKGLSTVFLTEIMRVLDINGAGIWIQDKTNDCLIQTARKKVPAVDIDLKKDKGFIHKTFISGEHLESKNLLNDPITLPEIKTQNDKEIGGATFPIHTKGGVIGVLLITTPKDKALSQGETGLLITLSEILGNAIRRMELTVKTGQQLKNLVSLHKIDLAITTELDLSKTLTILIEEVRSRLNADAADILLSENNETTMKVGAFSGFQINTSWKNLDLDNVLTEKVIRRKKLVVVPDIRMEKGSAQQSHHLIDQENFIFYCGVPLITKNRLVGVLEIFQRKPFKPNREWISYLKGLGVQAAVAIENSMLFEDLNKSVIEISNAYEETIEGWAKALDMRDDDTEGHTRRVTDITLKLAANMGLSQEEIVHIQRGALLHDIGKMGIPDDILLKPGPLNEKEWKIMKTHPELAKNFLSAVDFLKPAMAIPYSHHEKWDGSGYPQGLKGEEIPIGARIFALVDVYDALTSDRPYRKAWPKKKAVEHIKSESGTHFDPEIVKLFLAFLGNNPDI